jgi:hypothetical protein
MMLETLFSSQNLKIMQMFSWQMDTCPLVHSYNGAVSSRSSTTLPTSTLLAEAETVLFRVRLACLPLGHTFLLPSAILLSSCYPNQKPHSFLPHF